MLSSDERIKKQRGAGRIRFYLWLGALSLLSILITGAFIYWPYLHFQNIEITGLKLARKPDIVGELYQKSGTSFWGRYFGLLSFLAWRAGPLELSTPLVKEARLELSWLDRALLVRITERGQFAIWCAEDKCVWLDPEGIILGPAPRSEGRLLPTFYAAGSLNAVNLRVAPENEFANLKKLWSVLQKSGVAIAGLNIRPDLWEAAANTPVGTKLFFGLSFDPTLTAAPLENLVAKHGLAKFSYIDFRVENKVYYKLKR